MENLRMLEAQREEVAHEEKIALADLEAVKAKERVAELKYLKARWRLDLQNALIRELSAQQAKPMPPE